MAESDEAVHLVIRGHVQGVFFRDSCRQVASELGVRGWVGNRPDGAVEAVVAGPPQAIEEMVAWARQGPPRARVDGVDSTPTDDPNCTGFEVR